MLTMNDFKGSSWPWCIDIYQVGTRWNIDSVDGDSVALTNQLPFDKSREKRDANTALAATAPELLDLVLEMLNMGDFYHTAVETRDSEKSFEDWEVKAKQIVNKALGVK